ncbi:cbb3-type cytochrome oxidase subunit 3 [Pseudomonas sp. UBA4194]|jgi:cytochrome c oxidase cbb3-type subunit 4|uniref:cbb3-type cytochrome oxidase subunit 3 n=1 Tax=Pseudomonas sp. UBA4194 TaxID=1947317 RepID=UPI0025E21C56|nr:cbb3-type cytochrome c oxidase subunit 3 [Pseudomonas sp. UBA4194]
MDIQTIRGLGTVVVMVAFIGLALWVFSARRKPDFDEATLLPFADDPEAAARVHAQQQEKPDRSTAQ